MNEAVKIADWNSVQCPSCGDPNGMHHRGVHVANRTAEDRDGFLVTVTDSTVQMSPLSDERFYGRRDDVRIDFECEICGPVAQLLIVQHKGRTILRWEPLT